MEHKCNQCGIVFITKRKTHNSFCQRCARIRKGITQYARLCDIDGTPEYDELFKKAETNLVKANVIEPKNGEEIQYHRCVFCGKVLKDEKAKYCKRCILEGFDSLHKETGRTSGWDRKVRQATTPRSGWRGQKCIGGKTWF